MPGLNKLRHGILLPRQVSVHTPLGCFVPCLEQNDKQAFPAVVQEGDSVGRGGGGGRA